MFVALWDILHRESGQKVYKEKDGRKWTKIIQNVEKDKMYKVQNIQSGKE